MPLTSVPFSVCSVSLWFNLFATGETNSRAA